MSGSYFQLQAKYNSLYNLILAQQGGEQTLAQVLAKGNDADGTAITGLSSLEGGALDLKFTELSINEDPGVATQVLTSQGAGLPAIWTAGGSGSQGLASVLTESNDAAGLGAINVAYIESTDGVYSASMSALNGFIASSATALVAVSASDTQAILNLSGPGNNCYVNAAADQMVFSAQNTAINLVAKGLQLDGADGVAGDVLTSSGPGVAATWQAAPTLAGDNVFSGTNEFNGISLSGVPAVDLTNTLGTIGFSTAAVAVGTLVGTGYAVPVRFGNQEFYLQLFQTP